MMATDIHPAIAELTQVRTDHLKPGMVVHLHNGVIRTVADVLPTQWVNHRNDPILLVRYQEGQTPEWSAGNTSNAAGLWNVAEVVDELVAEVLA